MADAIKNPQVSFLDEMDEDNDLDDFEAAVAGSATPAEENADPDSAPQPEDAVESAELDAVTGPLGTPDAGTPEADAAALAAAAQAAPAVPEPVPAQAELPLAAPEVVAPAAPSQPAPVEAAPPAEDITKVYTDWRVQTEDLLAQHHYKLNEEEMALLDTNPQEVIPKIAAKVYLDAVSAAITQVTNYLPRMVRSVIEQDAVNTESENQFFSAWPALKGHKESVLKIGQVYRQMNPQASAEQFVNEVGAAAMVSLRLDPQGARAPATPAAPAAFVPAAQTPQGGVAAPKGKVNPFTALNAEFDNFEEEID